MNRAKYKNLLYDAVKNTNHYKRYKIYKLDDHFLAKQYDAKDKATAQNQVRIGNTMYENNINTPYNHDIVELTCKEETCVYVIMDFIQGPMFWQLPDSELIPALEDSQEQLIKTIEIGIIPYDYNWSNRILKAPGQAYQIDINDYYFGNSQEVQQMLKKMSAPDHIEKELEQSSLERALGRMWLRQTRKKLRSPKTPSGYGAQQDRA